MAERAPPPDHRGVRGIRRLVEYAPSTGGLALWVRHEDRPAGAGAPVVSTDGATIAYSADFEKIPLAEQAGLIAHEVLHIALRHPQRYLELRRLRGDVDLELYTICADAIVNSALSHLAWLALPRGAVFLDKLLSAALGIERSVETALLEWDVEKLYRAIDDRASRAGAATARRGGERSHGNGPDRAAGGAPAASGDAQRDEVDGAPADGPKSARARAMGARALRDIAPGGETDAPPESEAEQARLWSERIARAHAGDGDHSMLRTLLADLPQVRTPWEQALRTQLARALSIRPGLSWSRPARSYIANQGRSGGRRLPFEPGTSASRRVARLVVVVDVSGSIADALLQRFAVEIEAMTRRREAELILVVGDDRVRRVARFEPGRSDLGAIVFNGCGGTDFTPLLEEADRHAPDIAVVLTDLHGPARFRPRWPVVWAVPEAHAQAEHPFGRKLALR